MSRKEQNLKIVRQFEVEHKRKPFELHEVYRWAKKKGLWEAPKDLEEKKFVDEVSKDLREVTIDDGEGGRVRYYHAVIKGNGAQGVLWGNVWDLPREKLEQGLAQRRQGSLADCRKTKADMEFINKNRFPNNPIVMSFNFDEDFAEEEALKQMQKNKKKKGAA
jgi:hypothetical protein